MLLRGPDLLTGGHAFGRRDVLISDGRVAAIGHQLEASGPAVDAAGLVLTPGLVDIHVHGAKGHDTLDASPEAFRAIGRFLARQGVTSWAPTTASHHRDILGQVLAAHAAHRRQPDEARSVGVHLEGPYLSHEQRGAQDPTCLRDPDPAEWRSWLASGQVSMITLAPERPGASQLIAAAARAGIAVALGHSGATYDQTIAAIDAGASHATHLFNGMAPFTHREPGVVGACLTDSRVWLQVIADLIHLHAASLQLTYLAAPQRTVLVSDAMRATGMGDGDYRLADTTVHVRDGVARTEAGGLAGSTLDLPTAVRNYQWATDCSLAEALHAASGVPAAALGLGRLGHIHPGSPADLLLLDPDGTQPLLTLIAGNIAHDDLPEGRWIQR